MPDTQTFLNIDAAKWTRIKAAVKAKAGIDITADAGIDSAKGITISWIYTPADESLSISPLKRSFFDPSQATIDTDIAQWIAQA